MKLKVIDKRIRTKTEGVFYKEIIKSIVDDIGKEKTVKNFDRVYIVRYKDNGREKYIRIGKKSEGITESYCKQKRAEFITLANNGELPMQIKRREKQKEITLDDLSDVYFEDKKIVIDGKRELSGSNKKQLGKYELHIKPLLGKKGIEELSRDDFKVLVKKLEEAGKAPKTINGVIDLARAIINYHIKEKELAVVNPTVGLKKLSVDDKRERFLSLDEVKELLEAVKGDDVLYRFVLMSLSTGGRLNTVLSIRKKDIDLVHKTVTLHDYKNGKTYTGFIDTDKHLEVIQNALEGLKADDKYFNIAERTLTRHLKKILDRLFNAGLKVKDSKNRVVIHTLRHTFASQLVMKGKSLYVVQKLMNHSDIKMTERYAKLAPSVGMDAVRGLYE